MKAFDDLVLRAARRALEKLPDSTLREIERRFREPAVASVEVEIPSPTVAYWCDPDRVALERWVADLRDDRVVCRTVRVPLSDVDPIVIVQCAEQLALMAGLVGPVFVPFLDAKGQGALFWDVEQRKVTHAQRTRRYLVCYDENELEVAREIIASGSVATR